MATQPKENINTISTGRLARAQWLSTTTESGEFLCVTKEGWHWILEGDNTKPCSIDSLKGLRLTLSKRAEYWNVG